MITLSNGHSFEYVSGSGALRYAAECWLHEKPLKWMGIIDPSLFTNVMKTVTLKPREGNFRWWNPLRCIRPLFDGTKIVGAVNAVGLTNPGIYVWVEKYGQKIDSKKIPIVGSIFGEPNEIAVMVEIMNLLDLVALEINASCPNTNDDVLTNTAKIIKSCQIAKARSRHPLWLKLSVANDVDAILPKIESMIEVLEINSIPWRVIFPELQSPLAEFGGGGVSGKIAQDFTWTLLRNLVSITSIPVVGPSVWDFGDMEKVKTLGAKAVSFASVFMCHPWRPTCYVRKDMQRQQKGAV